MPLVEFEKILVIKLSLDLQNDINLPYSGGHHISGEQVEQPDTEGLLALVFNEDVRCCKGHKVVDD